MRVKGKTDAGVFTGLNWLISMVPLYSLPDEQHSAGLGDAGALEIMGTVSAPQVTPAPRSVLGDAGALDIMGNHPPNPMGQNSTLVYAGTVSAPLTTKPAGGKYQVTPAPRSVTVTKLGNN